MALGYSIRNSTRTSSRNIKKWDYYLLSRTNMATKHGGEEQAWGQESHRHDDAFILLFGYLLSIIASTALGLGVKQSVACAKVCHCNFCELASSNFPFDKDLTRSSNLDIATTRSYLVVNGPSNKHVWRHCRLTVLEVTNTKFLFSCLRTRLEQVQYDKAWNECFCRVWNKEVLLYRFVLLRERYLIMKQLNNREDSWLTSIRSYSMCWFSREGIFRVIRMIKWCKLHRFQHTKRVISTRKKIL